MQQNHLQLRWNATNPFWVVNNHCRATLFWLRPVVRTIVITFCRFMFAFGRKRKAPEAFNRLDRNFRAAVEEMQSVEVKRKPQLLMSLYADGGLH